MGQPAATLGDTAAHGGSIAVGSPTVFIGGRPAARLGDSVACGQHGTGTIAKGSMSVFINGQPAARLGDPTACLVPGLAAASVPPVLGLPPVTKARSLDRAKDGKTHAENDDADGISAAHAEYTKSDADHDGVMDTHAVSAELLRVRKAKDRATGDGKEERISGALDMFYGNAQVSKGSNALAMDGTNAEVGVAKGSITLSGGDAGSKGVDPDYSVTGEGHFLHAKVEREGFLGTDGRGKYGGLAKGEVSGQVAGGDVSVMYKSPTVAGYNAQLKVKTGGEFAGFGGGLGAWGFLDTAEKRVHMGANALLEVFLGAKYEWDVSLGKISAGVPVGGIAGLIATGNPRVLIG